MKPIKSFLLLFLTLIFVLGLSSTSVFAEDTETDAIITVEPSKVEIKAEQGSNHFAATFQLKASQDVTNVRILLRDMKPADEETTFSILPSEITVTSTDGSDDLVENVSSEWVITVGEGITEAGKWEGIGTIEWESPDLGDSDPVTFEIAIESTEEPQGEAGLLELEKLVVAGVRNKSCEDCPRTVLINETTGETELKGLDVTLNDLRSDDTPPKVYTRDNIKKEIGDDQQYPSVELSFDYEDVKAGLYKGKVWFTFDNADDLELPVEVYVKDGRFWPIVVMIFGILLAWSITYYSQNLREKDTLFVKIEIIEKFMDSLKQDNAKPFFNRMNSILIGQKGKIDDANKDELAAIKTEYQKAQAIKDKWDNWQKYQKDDYEKCMKGLVELKQKVDEINTAVESKSLFINSVSSYIDELYGGKVVDYKDIEQFSDDLICVRHNVEKYEESLSDINTLEENVKKYIKEGSKGQFIDPETGSIPVLMKELLNLKPSALDLGKCETLVLDQIVKKYEEIKGQYEEATKKSVIDREKTDQEESERESEWWKTLKVATVGIFTKIKKLVTNRKFRLVFFSVITHITALVILALTGYAEYENNASFGGFTDYSTLFFWGFGIGVARDAAIKLVQGWGINIPTGG